MKTTLTSAEFWMHIAYVFFGVFSAGLLFSAIRMAIITTLIVPFVICLFQAAMVAAVATIAYGIVLLCFSRTR